MLSFLQKHGDRSVQETPGPRKRFPSTLQLVQQEIFSRSPAVNAVRHVRMDNQESQLVSPRKRGGCVCVCVRVYTLILS